MAKKRSTKRSGNSVASLPAGFTNMGSSDRAPSWQPEEGDTLQGTVVGRKDIDAKKAGREKAKKGETAIILSVADSDGVIRQAWDSFGTRAAFEKARIGDQIFLRLDSIVKRGKKQYKNFTVGLKQKGKK